MRLARVIAAYGTQAMKRMGRSMLGQTHLPMMATTVTTLMMGTTTRTMTTTSRNVHRPRRKIENQKLPVAVAGLMVPVVPAAEEAEAILEGTRVGALLLPAGVAQEERAGRCRATRRVAERRRR